MTPGQVLGHTYEIEAHLARGGMGEVYRARHIELGTSHAIKVILPELAEDPKIISLFQEEARKLSRVRNDAVVAYEGLFKDENGVRYLVMEFVDGTQLSKIIRQGPLSVTEVRQLRDRCAMGLAAAHEKRIFHRDIAPDNIILVGNRPEFAKIIDFGIAKSSDPGDKTVIGQDFAGKYSYVSPEQLGLYGGVVDGRSDIYSLGLVLVAAAAGRALDMGSSPVSVVEARRTVPDLGSVPTELRAELAPLLEPNPADRPQSMRELPGSSLSQEGTAWSSGYVPSSVEAQHTQPGSRPTPSSGAGTKTTEPEKTGGSRRGVAIAAGIGAFLLVVGIGAFFLLPGKQPQPSESVSVPAPKEPAPPSQVTQQQPPPVAQPTVSLPALQAALSDFPCAHLEASVAGGNNVAISGFVGNAADLQRLGQVAQNAGAVSTATASVKIYEKPLCEIAKLLEETPAFTTGARPAIAFDNAARLYHDGDLIAITATAPSDRGGYLYVEDFATDGTVVHMLPTNWVPGNRIAAGASVTLGTLDKAALNATGSKKPDVYGIGPPYGPTMIVAILTSKPIFPHSRPQQENAADYLKELRHRLMLDSPGEASPIVAGGYEIYDVEK
jgi:serine/threonine protein kinase